MYSEYEEYNNGLMKELNYLISDISDKLSLAACKMLMTMSEEDRKLAIETTENYQLKKVFIAAFQNEHYEICAVIKAKLIGKL